MSENRKLYDVTIIGAGPVGLFAAFYAGMRQMSIHLMDSLPQVGGQLSALYPEKFIYDMPGFSKVRAKELVDELWRQAQLGKPDLTLNEKVEWIEKKATDSGEDIFHIHTSENGTHLSRTVILASGMGAFTPQKLNRPGLEEREGQSVHYVMKPLRYFENRDVLVIGGGDSAVDWALALSETGSEGKAIARHVSLIHRGQKFTAHESTVEKLYETQAAVLLTHELAQVETVHDAGRERQKVTIENNKTKESREIVVDDIVVCIGYLAKLDFVKKTGLEMKGQAIVVDQRMQTSLPGIFAVGDTCTHEAKLKLIATGVGEAAIAANFAKVLIDPKAKAFPGHSTSKLETRVP